MVSVQELISRLRFWRDADRIGPDIPLTHWRLYFKKAMRELCIKKFKSFGEGSEFRPGAYAVNCSRISIGANVVIRPGTMLFADNRPSGAEIIIEDKVSIGSGVHFISCNHMYSIKNTEIYDQGHEKPNVLDTIILKRGCWVGANAILLPGIQIGENSVVGAGTIATKSVPPHVVFAGNPGKIIKDIK